MSFATATSRAASNDLVNRRLAAGVMLSIVLHAMLLMIRFGVPGLGLPTPFAARPVTITLAPPVPETAPQVAEQVASPLPLPPLAPPAPSGMRLVAPAPRPALVVAAKPTPVKPRRISRPLPPPKPIETAPTPVIAQDQNLNDFVVPLQQPQEAVQKTIDPKEAQEGVDDGAELRAAQQAAQTRRQEESAAVAAAEAKVAQETQAKMQAAQQAEDDSRRQAEAASRVAAEAQAQQRRAEQAASQQKAEELALRRKAEEIASRQKAAELAAQQKVEEAARQKAAQLTAQQKAEETARQKAAELAAQQKAEEAARRKAEELAAQQKAEEAARQQAAQAARQQAGQAARQQAEQAAAAGQRERERAAAAAANSGAGVGGAGEGGAGTTTPKNMFGSDAANRVRELSRGIDLLSGDPPRARPAEDRGGRRIVVGPGERDVPLRMYVDSFRQKIERNGGVAFSPLSADRVRIEPIVSVAIRSDGSVEEVTIVRSSGQAETDNMVRRIVRVNARYSAFPPNIASRYDVIEIRRVWSFAETLRLLEEVR